MQNDHVVAEAKGLRKMGAHISGKEATYVALEANKRGPIVLEPAAELAAASANAPEPGSRSETTNSGRKPPARVRKPSPGNDRCLAPTPDLEGHRARLRDAFGGTMSDEFVDVMLGKLVEALRPSPHDYLEEATMEPWRRNAGRDRPQLQRQQLTISRLTT
jgi:hypothetical protein